MLLPFLCAFVLEIVDHTSCPSSHTGTRHPPLTALSKGNRVDFASHPLYNAFNVQALRYSLNVLNASVL
jgi:hypothetical protein